MGSALPLTTMTVPFAIQLSLSHNYGRGRNSKGSKGKSRGKGKRSNGTNNFTSKGTKYCPAIAKAAANSILADTAHGLPMLIKV